MKKRDVITKEERAIERAIGRGDYAPVRNPEKELARFAQIAKNTTAKTKTVNIRISKRDYTHLKARAMQEGIPYQTYITSLVHKAVKT